MKANKINEMIKKSVALTALLAVSTFTSCAPQSQGDSSYYQDETSTIAGIIGGVSSTSDFQKQNGIVQLRMISLLGESTCTGSLIAPNIVLTAAHCVEDRLLKRVAVLFSLSDKQLTKEQVVFATRAVIHPKYSPSESSTDVWNDVAILKLAQDAPADFELAQLPKKDVLVQLEKGSTLTLAGFGITNAVVRKVVKDKKGRDRMVDVPSQGTGTLRQVSGIEVTGVTSDLKEISLDQKNLKGACHGDSGGPALLQLEDGSQLLVGVTSRGTEKLGNCNQGAIYTGVIGHLDWINSTVAALNAPVAAIAQK